MNSRSPAADDFAPATRLASIVADFSEAIGRLVARLEQIDDVTAHDAPEPGSWSAAQVGCHVAIATDAFGDLIAGRQPGAEPAPPGFREPPWEDVQQRVPARAVAPREAWPPDNASRREAIASLQASHDRFVAMLRDLPDGRGSRYCLTHPYVGTISLFQVAEWAAAHAKRHNAQAKRAVAAAQARRAGATARHGTPRAGGMTSIVDQLRVNAATVRDKTAFVSGDERLSYAELDRLSDARAAMLIEAGIKPGERLALDLPGGLDLIVAYYAAFKVGAIAVPISPRSSAAEAAFILEDAGAAVYTGLRPAGEGRTDAARSGGHAPSTLALILYTSGTTGRAKGVVHTHGSLAASAESLTRFAFRSDDVFLNALPLSHMAGLSSLLGCVAAGCTTVLMPFDADAVLNAIVRHHVTVVSGTPVMFRMLMEAHGERIRDTTTVRAWFVGADAVPGALQEEFHARFERWLWPVYGMSEIAPVSWAPADKAATGLLGRPVDGCEMRLLDDHHREVPSGQTGQLAVRGPSLMRGYWNDPEATARVLNDGWLLTGDLAWRDDEGLFWSAGRRRDIIITGGFNVSCAEVEDVLARHPAVLDAAVVGAPDDRWGEAISAFVVLRQGQAADAATLIEFVRGRLARYKAPKSVTFVDALPRTASGKIQRTVLRETPPPDAAAQRQATTHHDIPYSRTPAQPRGQHD